MWGIQEHEIWERVVFQCSLINVDISNRRMTSQFSELLSCLLFFVLFFFNNQLKKISIQRGIFLVLYVVPLQQHYNFHVLKLKKFESKEKNVFKILAKLYSELYCTKEKKKKHHVSTYACMCGYKHVCVREHSSTPLKAICSLVQKSLLLYYMYIQLLFFQKPSFKVLSIILAEDKYVSCQNSLHYVLRRGSF